jgi:hypothetical protein
VLSCYVIVLLCYFQQFCFDGWSVKVNCGSHGYHNNIYFFFASLQFFLVICSHCYKRFFISCETCFCLMCLNLCCARFVFELKPQHHNWQHYNHRHDQPFSSVAHVHILSCVHCTLFLYNSIMLNIGQTSLEFSVSFMNTFSSYKFDSESCNICVYVKLYFYCALCWWTNFLVWNILWLWPNGCIVVALTL